MKEKKWTYIKWTYIGPWISPCELREKCQIGEESYCPGKINGRCPFDRIAGEIKPDMEEYFEEWIDDKSSIPRLSFSRRQIVWKRRRAANIISDLKHAVTARDILIYQIVNDSGPKCFSGCLYFDRCEHQEPNLCGVAVPRQRSWEDDEPWDDIKWDYPTVGAPTPGYTGPPRLWFSELSDWQLRDWIDWRAKRIIHPDRWR